MIVGENRGKLRGKSREIVRGDAEIIRFEGRLIGYRTRFNTAVK